MEFYQKKKNLKIELPYDLAILLDIFLKKNENTNLKRYCIPIFTVALFTVAKIWKQAKCPSTDEWIKKTGIHTHWNTTQP